MKQEANPQALRFSGRPERLEALVPLCVDHQRHRPCIDVRIGAARPQALPPVLQLQTENVSESATWLRFTLPRSTPPGRYDAVVRLGGDEHHAEILVEPLQDLLIAPVSWSGTAAPGSRSVVGVTLINRGNTAVIVPRVLAFGIFEAKGVENSLALAYRDPTARGLDRLARVADELALRNALVRVVVAGGPHEIDVGGAGRFDLELRWPTKLRPGHRYGGYLALHNVRWTVQVSVPRAEAAAEEPDSEEEK